MPIREFADESGDVWMVWSTLPRSGANVRPQYAAGWLSFQCGDARRRYVPIPPDWENAGEDELRAWLGLAHEAGRAEGEDAPPGTPPHQPDAAEGADAARPARGDPRTPGGIARVRKLLRGIRVRGDEP